MSIVKNSPPLQTNVLRKIVFIFSSFVSMFFNALLFSSIGDNVFLRIVWGMIGVGAVLFQTLKLREYINSKRKNKLSFLFYVICTLGSIAGTLGAGYSHIEKTKINMIDKKIRLETVNSKLKYIDSGKEKTILISRLENLQAQAKNITNSAYWLQYYDKKIKKLTDEIYNNNEKEKTIESLNRERGELIKAQSGIISSVSGLSKLFKMNEELTTFYFLIFCSLIIEMMVYGSSNFNGNLFSIVVKKKKRITKLKKEKKQGQTFFNIRKLS